MNHEKPLFFRYLCCCIFLTLGTACLPQPDPDPLETLGEYAVYRQDISVDNPEDAANPIPAKIFAPSEDNGSTIAPGPFELTIFLPGFAAHSAYEVYAEHLASHGFAVVFVKYVIPAGFDGHHDYVARQVTYVLDNALSSENPLAGHIDATKIAISGHSIGGKIAFYAAAIDPRISVVMAMDPSNSGGPPCFISQEFCNAYPVAPNYVTGEIGMLDDVNTVSFIMRAKPDPLANPDPQNNAEYFFYGTDGAGLHGVAAPALYFNLENKAHTAWAFNNQVIRISKRSLVAWLKVYFHGENMDEYLTGAIVQADVDAGHIAAIETRY